MTEPLADEGPQSAVDWRQLEVEHHPLPAEQVQPLPEDADL